MQATAAPPRHFGMDWLRIGAFQLLILYHVGMAFVPWPYEVKVAEPPSWSTVPMLLTNPWRLSLLFVVSGYASGAILARCAHPGAFLRRRIARLVLPLLFGVIVLVPPQAWVSLVTQHGYRAGFGTFLLRDAFSFRIIDGVALPAILHLWFVLYLLAYTIVLILLLAVVPASVRHAVARAIDRLAAGPLLLPGGVAALLAIRGIVPPGWTDTHAFVDDWSAHATYLAMFLFGVFLRGSEPTMAAAVRLWPAALTLAAIGWIGLAWYELDYPGDDMSAGLRALHRLFRAAEAWGAIIALVGIAERFANRDGRWRATLAEAVFPFYLVHQTIIVVTGYRLIDSDAGPLTRFAILVAAAAAGCWAFYLVGRRIGPLRPWIGLKPVPARRATP